MCRFRQYRARFQSINVRFSNGISQYMKTISACIFIPQCFRNTLMNHIVFVMYIFVNEFSVKRLFQETFPNVFLCSMTKTYLKQFNPMLFRDETINLIRNKNNK